jgi:23S rRNA pseudoU1915 N3-methylase RlmH
MISELNQLKEDYIKECFPESVTTDPLELDFIGKELEVMSRDELEKFYQDNFRDSNKMRLFAIEAKRRSRSEDSELKMDAASLKMLQDSHSIQDRVIKVIDERIKYLNAMMQLSSAGLYLVKIDEEGDMQCKQISFKDVAAVVNGRSTMAMPQEIDIFDLMGWR